MSKPKPPPLEPPREGLIPGTWKVMDPTRLGGIVDRPRLHSRWTPRHVGMRLIEAHRTLTRLPGGGASIQSAPWPMYELEVAPPPAQNARLLATADEIARMEQAITWPMQFLSAEPAKARDVNLWASQLTVEEFEKVEDGDNKVPWEALQMIAECLDAARERVQ
jgi:hypothetical protein